MTHPTILQDLRARLQHLKKAAEHDASVALCDAIAHTEQLIKRLETPITNEINHGASK